VNSVAFSSDGLQIASGGHEQVLEANLRSSRSEVNHKDIYQELPVKFVTTFIDGFMRVWQVIGKGVGIVVRKLWRPKFRILCATNVILDGVAGLSSNHKKALTQRGAIDRSSAPTRMNSEE
ncbi:hypothetical protein BGZ90_007005, partial [Linnemannia elongata]